METTGNRRVDRLLQCAERHGLSVEEPRHVRGCWVVRGDNGDSLTVFGGANHKAEVYLDRQGSRAWDQIPQRDAMALMSQGSLMLERGQ